MQCLIRFFLFFVLVFFQGIYVLADDSDSYALSTGYDDMHRLKNLNKAVNGYSIALLKQYVKPGDKVLDVGAGIGLISQEIVQIVGTKGKVMAVDISADQLKIAHDLSKDKYLHNLTFKHGSAYDLSGIKEQQDAIYIRFVLMHLRDVNKAVAELARHLKPGGYMILEELIGNDTIASDPEDKRLDLVKEVDTLQEEVQKTDFTIAATLDKTLEANGLKVVQNTTFHPKLDNLNKRRNFSMGMRSLEKTLVANNKISKKALHQKIKKVEQMEEDPNVELYFYEIGQVVGQKP